ncbi:MAG: ATP-grasp protein, partial [Oerskovia sp.]|nr:ATP-grasp protein [Oerskovia sp.]
GVASDAVVHVDDGQSRRASLTPVDRHAWRLVVDGVGETVHLATGADGSVWLARAGRVVQVAVPTRAERLARRAAARRDGSERTDGPSSPDVRAGMPGTVVAVAVTDGETVAAGAVLVVVEAMKMEHPLTAPHAGVVRLTARPGDLVRRDEVVARVEPSPDDAAPAPAGVSATLQHPQADIPAVPVPSHTPGAP